MLVKIVPMLLPVWLLKIVKIKKRIENNLYFDTFFLLSKYSNIYFQHNNQLLIRPKHCNCRVELVA